MMQELMRSLESAGQDYGDRVSKAVLGLATSASHAPKSERGFRLEVIALLQHQAREIVRLEAELTAALEYDA